MTLQDLGALGEFLGLFAILVTLFYLAKQTQQGVEIGRGKETRTLINQFNVYMRMMTEAPYIHDMRKAMESYRAMHPDEQARAFLILVQWVNFYEQTMYAKETGLVPQPVENAIRAYVIGFLITPGGAEFWEDFRHVFGVEVSSQLDAFIAKEELPPPITDTYPWLRPLEGAVS